MSISDHPVFQIQTSILTGVILPYLSLEDCKKSDALFQIYYDNIIKQLNSINNQYVQSYLDKIIFSIPARELTSIMEKAQNILDIIKNICDKAPNLSLDAMKEQYKDFYIQNILAFWRRLPGGEDYLNSAQVKNLNDFQKVNRFKDWIEHNKAVLERLQTLNLSHCNLSFLPDEINSFINLTHLNLEHNELICLPYNFNPPNLTHLNLEHNKLCFFNPKFNPPKLQELNLINNELVKLHPDFCPPNLQLLRIRGTNILKTLPASLAKSKKLRIEHS